MILAAVIAAALALMLLVMGMAIVARDWAVFRMSAGISGFLAVVLVSVAVLTP